MKRLLLIACTTLFTLLSAGLLLAQAPRFIQFETETHDFGNIREVDGDAKHSFVFKNITDQPIKLTYVKPSCSCTAPDWSKDVIQPGQEGFVQASYGVANRPGAFDKTVTVKAAVVGVNGEVDSSAAESVYILRIKGDVEARPKGPEDWYPMAMGSLRGSSNHIAFGNIFSDEVREQSITLYNNGEKTVTVSNLNNAGNDHLSLRMEPRMTIAPKDSVKLFIQYDASKVSDWGFLHTSITLQTDDENEPNKQVYVSADRRENLPDVESLSPAELAKLPKVVFDKTVHDFGVINNTETVKTTFTIKNEGGSELVIRKTKASCGCTAGSPAKMNLAPGESTNFEVSFSPVGKSGKQNKTVTVITNDPANPVTTISIQSDIQVETGHNHEDHSGHTH
jgi:hypothetical protein